MSERQKMTEAEVRAILDRIWGPPVKPKPKVVTSDAKVVRDAVVKVGPDVPAEISFRLFRNVHHHRF
jgi:hypothetical protein